MPRERPTVLTTMGVLNIVFGSVFLLCAVCSGMVHLLQFHPPGVFPGRVNPASDLWAFLSREVPAYPVVLVGHLVLGGVLNLLLLVAGIGLLNQQAWARVVSLVYAILTLLSQLGVLVFWVAV